MIVKLQRAQFPSGGLMLIYNEDKSVYLQAAETRPLLARLGDRATAYFEATVNDAGELHVGEEAPEQAW